MTRTCAALALLLLVPATAIAQCDPEILSHRGGAPQCLDRSGDRVHCVFGDELMIIDITNIATPRIIGSVLIPGGGARDIDVADGYAYIVAGHNGLIVVDVSAPASAAVVAAIPVDQSVTEIVVSNGRAFVCGEESGDDRVFILDLAVPEAPVVASIYEVADAPTSGVAVSGDFLFAGSLTGVEIVDVSNLAIPFRRAIYDAESFMVDLDVAGDTLFLQTVSVLEIVDVTNTYVPAQLSTYDTDTWGRLSVNSTGTLAYAEGFSGVEIIDVLNPAAPTLEATIENTFGADMLASGVYLFHADTSDGLVLWDCTNAAAPQQLWTLDLRPSSPTGFVASDRWMAFAENQELIIFDVTTPGNPVRTAIVPLGSNSAELVLDGDLLYETDRSAGLQIFDLAAANGPTVIGTSPTGLYPEALARHDEFLVVALLDGTLEIYDVSDPRAPFLRGSAPPPVPDTARDLVVSGGFAYVLRFQTGVDIFDLADPAAPTLVHTIPGDDAHDISVRNSLLCIARSNSFGDPDSVLFYDVSDPATPAYRGTYELAAFDGASTAFHDGTLIVCDGQTGLTFLDISNPAAPRVVHEFPMGSGAAQVVPTGDRLWIIGGGLWETTLQGDPRVVADPVDTEVCAGFIATFQTEAAAGVAYAWRRNGSALRNGGTGNGSIITGAFTSTLTIAGTREADAGVYDCVVLSPCGVVGTTPATLSVVTTCCAADFNSDGARDSTDFFGFLTAFFAHDPAADLNADGAVASDDFFNFIGAFFAGC